MKPILAIETSTRTGSVALLCPPSHAGAEDILFTADLHQEQGHAQTLLPTIDHLLAQAQLTPSDLGLVAFGQGPGAFTGIRLGCSVAQGIAVSLDLPIVAVNALQMTASAFENKSGVKLVALDARMDEVYFAVYAGEIELQAPVLLHALDVAAFVSARLSYWLRAVDSQTQAQLVGEGWQVVHRCAKASWVADLGVSMIDQKARPHARDLAFLALRRSQQGRAVTPEQALPLYLRDKVAYTSAERVDGLGGNPKAAVPEDFVLLPMMPIDLAEVLELERQSQAFPWSLRNFEDALAAGYPGWIVRVQGILVGFCVAMTTPDDVHVLVIAVSSDHRRQGLGRRLLGEVHRLAQTLGLEKILLEVRPSNTRALAFYGRQGFNQIGLRKGYYPAGKGQREDALVLACSVDGV